MTPDALRDDADDRAALYLAGALPPEERGAFEEALAAGDSQLAEALQHLESAVTALADAAPPVAPCAHVRASLLARIAAAQEKQRERSHRAVVARAQAAVWRATPVPGVEIRLLHLDRAERRFAALLRMQGGCRYPAHPHGGPEEFLVLEGDVQEGDVVYRAGDYRYSPAGSHHGEQYTEGGCLMYVSAPLAALHM